jgi:hypothetical protein
MTTEHRKAPRRDVLEIRRIGNWGHVQYMHILSCGHMETRPRASASPKLACVECLRIDSRVIEMKSVASPARISDVTDDEMATAETEIYLAQATIASKFGVPIDSVDVVTVDDGGNLRVRYATVFLTEKDVRRIASNKER